jgi:cobalt/nickel transport system permease protein
MLNFPVAGGTSGHLVGGVLAAVLVGPSAAVIVMTAVLILQCLVFGDGGLLALGANVLNMGIIHPLVGFAIYRAIAGPNAPAVWAPRRIAAVAFACWVATVIAAATCAGELALSRAVAAEVVLPAMVGTHLVVGAGEAVISALVFVTVLRLRPEVLDARSLAPRGRTWSLVVPGLSASAAIALFVSPFACTWPDGLERVVERLGIEPTRAAVSIPAPLRDYAMPGLHGAVRVSAAALAGTLLVFALCFALGLALAPRQRTQRTATP